jgi:predicted transcriptional regulator
VSLESDAPDCLALTAFQRDLLVAVVDCDRTHDGPVTGLVVMDRVEELRAEPTNHGRLYPNLDALDEAGLVAKTSVDGRSNEYRPTDRGVAALEARVDRLADVTGQTVMSAGAAYGGRR